MRSGVSRSVSTPTNSTMGRLPGPVPIEARAEASVFR